MDPRLTDLKSIVISPITNQEDFNRASTIIDTLVDADLIEDETLRKKALDLLEAITLLAVAYEKKQYPIEKLDPIEAIRQRMETLNLSQKEVAKYFGGENRVSEVLNGRRPLTLKMIKISTVVWGFQQKCCLPGSTVAHQRFCLNVGFT